MSYLPYDPNVWPAATMDDTRPHVRVAKWIWGIVLYLLAIVAWVVWMKMPTKIEDPLALIPLGNGQQLRLIHINTGLNSGTHTWSFENRIRAENRGFGPRLTDEVGGAWMFFTQFSDRSDTFRPPNFSSFEIVEEGSPYALQSSRRMTGNGPYDVILLPVIPRRSPTLTVKFAMNGPSQQATITNPFFTPATPPFIKTAGAVVQSAPAAPPQQLEGDGFVVRLEGVSFRTKSFSGNTAAKVAEPRIAVTCPHTKSGDFQASHEWFDPTGNRVKDGALPWSEPVWGLRVKVKEGHTFPIPAERRIKLAELPVPGTGQVVPLKVLNEMKIDGVTDVLVVGAGSYMRSGRTITGSATSGGPVISQVQTYGNQRFGGFTASTWEIRIISQMSDGSPKFRSRVRVLKGDAQCQPSSTGRSSSMEFHEESLGSFHIPKVGPVKAGDTVAIEVIFPKTYIYEFHIPRPAFVEKP